MSAGYQPSIATTYLSPLPIAAAAGTSSRSDWRASIQSMPGNEEARRALQDTIADDAFERAKAQANSKARDVAADTYRPSARNSTRATDADDQVPPYWLTAGEEYGDDKQRDQ
jgi:hypothetical protein